MYVISIIPIVEGIGVDTLTYFSKTDLSLGLVVDCQIRSRVVRGLVISSVEAKYAKQELRDSNFSIKKITNLLNSFQLYSHQYIQSLLYSASYHALPLSFVLSLLTPKVILDKHKDFENTKTYRQVSQPQKVYLQDNFKNRVASYNALIAAKSNTVYIVCPTKASIIALEKSLQTEKFIVTLHSSLSQSKQYKNINILRDNPSESFCCLITPQYISLIHNIETVILHNYSDSAYCNDFTHYFDYRTFLDIYLQKVADTIIISDDYIQQSENTPKLEKPEKIALLDTSVRGIVGKDPLFSEQVKRSIQEVKRNNGNTFIYVGRKGLQTYTICEDCKNILSCECGSALVLFETKAKKKYYSCTNNHKKYILNERDIIACPVCTSWRLKPLGGGTEQLSLALTTAGYTTFECTSNTASSPKQIESLLQSFYSTPGSILIATELVIPYISKQVTQVIATNFDSLFALHIYNTDEILLRLLLQLYSLSSNNMIIESHFSHLPILKSFKDNSLAVWKKGYLQSLSHGKFPPFGVVVKIYSKNIPEVTLVAALSDFDVIKNLQEKRHYGLYLLEFRLDKEVWQSEFYLREYLASLPKTYEVAVV